MAVVANPIPPYVGFTTDRIAMQRFYYANGTAPGVYTAAFYLPAGTFLLDVFLIAKTLWAGNSTAAVIVGDADDDNGYIVSTNLLATDLLAGESISIAAGTAMAGGKIGAYVANSQWTSGSGTYGQYSPLARTVTATLTTTGGTATAGETFVGVRFLTINGAEPIANATYVAS